MPDVLIALGGNVGDVAATMQTAIERLDSLDQVNVIAKSRLYSTQPVGSDAGDAFVNAAITVRTDLKPTSLLDQLLSIEDELGRRRLTHWGPRVIDLDLILYEEEVISTDRLTVPHAACFYRRFVLDPAVDIAAEWIHPNFGEPLSSIRTRLLQRPLPICLFGDAVVERELAIGRAGSPLPSNAKEGMQEHALLKLQTDVEFTESVDEAVLVFDATETQTGPNVIQVFDVENRLAFAKQVLIAATDEPRCVGQLS